MGWFGQSPQQGSRAPLEVAFRNSQDALGGLLGRIARLKRESENGRAVIAFTAPTPGVGATTLAACCSLGLARLLGLENVLVEADLHAPAISHYLGVDRSPGLTDVLLSETSLDDAVRNSMEEGFHVLTAGRSDGVAGSRISSERLGDAVRDLKARHGIVVLDAPPLLQYPDAALVLEHADAAVVVLAARSTKKLDARRTIERLGELGVPCLGTLFNRYRSDMPFGLGDPDA